MIQNPSKVAAIRASTLQPLTQGGPNALPVGSKQQDPGSVLSRLGTLAKAGKAGRLITNRTGNLEGSSSFLVVRGEPIGYSWIDEVINWLVASKPLASF
jgi:hypothetical protein